MEASDEACRNFLFLDRSSRTKSIYYIFLIYLVGLSFVSSSVIIIIFFFYAGDRREGGDNYVPLWSSIVLGLAVVYSRINYSGDYYMTTRITTSKKKTQQIPEWLLLSSSLRRKEET